MRHRWQGSAHPKARIANRSVVVLTIDSFHGSLCPIRRMRTLITFMACAGMGSAQGREWLDLLSCR
jgi:hypothetical protein